MHTSKYGAPAQQSARARLRNGLHGRLPVSASIPLIAALSGTLWLIVFKLVSALFAF